MTQSPDFAKENIEILKSRFPTIVKEGKIDLEELQAFLGDKIDKDEEYYRLNSEISFFLNKSFPLWSIINIEQFYYLFQQRLKPIAQGGWVTFSLF